MGSLLHVEYCSEDLETTNSLNLHKQPYKIRAIIIIPISHLRITRLGELKHGAQNHLVKWQGKVPAPGNCLQSPMKK